MNSKKEPSAIAATMLGYAKSCGTFIKHKDFAPLIWTGKHRSAWEWAKRFRSISLERIENDCVSAIFSYNTEILIFILEDYLEDIRKRKSNDISWHSGYRCAQESHGNTILIPHLVASSRSDVIEIIEAFQDQVRTAVEMELVVGVSC